MWWRECEECHLKMPMFTPRMRADDGRLLCPGCHPDGKGAPGRPIGVHGNVNVNERIRQALNQPEENPEDRVITTLSLRAESALTCEACGAEMGEGGLRVEAGKLVCPDGCIAGKNEVPCPRCNGRGRVMGVGTMKNCPACHGRKTVPRSKVAAVAVEPEVDDGQAVPGVRPKKPAPEPMPDMEQALKMYVQRAKEMRQKANPYVTSVLASLDGEFVRWLQDHGLHESAELWQNQPWDDGSGMWADHDRRFWDSIPYGMVAEVKEYLATLNEGLYGHASIRPVEGGLRAIAHDSGDGATIYHCPFCGSGQVTGGADGTVECDFCKSYFTVQVQPERMAMPQTVNGQPQQMPGMPGDGTQPAPFGGIGDGAGAGNAPVFEPPDMNEALNNALQGVPAFAPPDQVPVTASKTAGPPSGRTAPAVPAPDDHEAKPEWDTAQHHDLCDICGWPVSKKGDGWVHDETNRTLWTDKRQAAKRYFLTPDGILPEESYLRHLAIRYADDRDGVIEQVRAERA